MRVVLVATSHPGNIGASARAMHTMGLEQLVLVAPRFFPHPQAIAMAAGGSAVLDNARITTSLDEALSGCAFVAGFSARPREFAGRVLPVRAVAHEALREAAGGDIALVFGTEMSGLSNAELACCNVVATIPTSPHYGSLNLAAAVQVAAYEMRVASLSDAVWEAPRFPAATTDETTALYAHATRTLTAMQFLDPQRPRRLLPRLRRLFNRSGLEKEEVNILRGILARIDALLK